MSWTLALSADPGDAVFSAGALLQSLPGEKRHVTLHGAAPGEEYALQLLGARHVALGTLVGASAKTLHDALTVALPQTEPPPGDPAIVLLPLDIAARPGDAALVGLLAKLEAQYPGTRCLHYYPIPFVNQHRQRFPELAFARPIRGIVEADAEAAVFQWKPRGTAVAAGPLITKRSAADMLRERLTAVVFPDPEVPPPTSPDDLSFDLQRALGTREWVQLV